MGRRDAHAHDAPMAVRDMRTHWFWVHDTIVDDYGPLLGVETLAIYASLCCFAARDAQTCWPSIRRLARHWRMSTRTVVAAIERLEQFRLIAVERQVNADGGRDNNVYTLLNPSPLPELAALLYAEARANGEPAAAASARLQSLLPDQWEPIRPNHAAFRSATEWRSLLDTLQAADETAGPPAPPLFSHEPRGAVLRKTGVVSNGTQGRVPQEHRGEVAGTTRPWSGGKPNNKQQNETEPNYTQNRLHPQQPNRPAAVAGAKLLSADEVQAYQLADDEVLVECDDQTVEVLTLEAHARREVSAAERRWGVPVRSECFYSTTRYLGEAPENAWTAEEERKIEAYERLRRELEATYEALGAFTLEEALDRFFEQRVWRHFPLDNPDERERIAGWIRYVLSAAAQNLKNPAGFLRRRIESDQWAPGHHLEDAIQGRVRQGAPR